MKVKRWVFLCTFLQVWLVTMGMATPPDSLFVERDPSIGRQKKSFFERNLVLLPVFVYAPETRFAFGGVFINLFKTSPKDTVSRTSNIRTAAIYSTRNQIIFSTDYNLFFKEERYQLRGNFAFLQFPDNFYGIGNDTRLEDEEVFQNNIFNCTVRALHNFGGGFFTGIQYNYYNMFAIRPETGKLLESSGVAGADGSILSGAGLLLSWDKRDNVFSPAGGHYLEFSYRNYTQLLGSEWDFNRFTVDLRKYFSTFKNQVVAFQLFAEAQTGDVPFQAMSLLGGDKLMRGIYRGRFRDNKLYSLQGEYRLPVNKWLGFTAFSGVGDVASRVGNFKWKEAKFAWGGGVRIALNRKERLNLRFDYGIAGDTQNFYINLAEAF